MFLTPTGQVLANRGRRRQNTVIRFLCAIGVPEETARIDATGIGHHVCVATLVGLRARYLGVVLHSGRVYNQESTLCLGVRDGV